MLSKPFIVVTADTYPVVSKSAYRLIFVGKWCHPILPGHVYSNAAQDKMPASSPVPPKHIAQFWIVLRAPRPRCPVLPFGQAYVSYSLALQMLRNPNSQAVLSTPRIDRPNQHTHHGCYFFQPTSSSNTCCHVPMHPYTRIARWTCACINIHMVLIPIRFVHVFLVSEHQHLLLPFLASCHASGVWPSWSSGFLSAVTLPWRRHDTFASTICPVSA